MKVFSMPNSSNKKSAAKSKQADKNSPASKNARNEKNSPSIKKEIKLLGLAGAGILLLLAVFVPGVLGFLGPFFRNLLLGLFGFGGVLLPIVIVCLAVLGLVSKEIRIPIWRTVILAWVVLAWLYVIVDPVGDNYYTIFEYFRAVYRTGHLASGGVVGSLLGRLIVWPLARVGAIIVLSLLIIILLVQITGRSFVKFIEVGVDKARTLYDERTGNYNDEDDDYEEHELHLVNPKSSSKAAQKKLPLRLRHAASSKGNLKGDKKAALIHIDPSEHDSDDDYTVLLVQEELDGQSAKPPRELPPFLRAAKPPKTEVKPKILTFSDEDMEISHDTKTIAAPPIQEDIEIDFIYDSSAAKQDTEGNEEKTAAGFVVRGMVDDAAPSVPPMFEYDDDIDPLEHDEYAYASRGKHPTDPIMTAHPVQLEPDYANFELPSLDLLAKRDKPITSPESRTQIMQNSRILEETLRSFRVEAEVVEVIVGPTVTRYSLAPGPGVKVSSISNLSNDLALSLAAQGIRIEAPIPGKSAVGIELPNKEPQGVFLREILECERFQNFSSKLAFALGKDIAGSPVVADVAEMPHLLIAGATGAGKSVCINTLIASLLYKSRPDEVKLLMIDPKVVELSVYNGIPHLLIPVVTDPKKASGALNWAVQEMESRYIMFAETNCRDIKGYNRYLDENDKQKLPQIVIIIDELADLMMTCKGEVEEAICRLAQKARAAGIHLIVATQRPSVDVITGLIKANIPSRLAFAVSSGMDSRTVLDMQGAEKLLGRGDMLFLPRGQNKPIRVQGGFISDNEVEKLVTFLKAQAPVTHSTDMIQQITMPGKAKIEGEVDEFFYDAVDFLLVKGKASTSMLQRQFRIGYNRASRLMEDLEMRGIVGPEDGVKPRKVTITREEFQEIYGDR
jgi:S-DNA-T family DNA segregation ATPase FtsK/SpoIIIE